MKMHTITVGFGVLFLALGLSAFVVSNAPTALIPCGFGILYFICGAIASHPDRVKHAMHGAAILGVIGFLASVTSWFKLPFILRGIYVARPLAVIEKSIMAFLSLIFVALCVNSFIQARKARNANKL